jgi:hypothetical protein
MQLVIWIIQEVKCQYNKNVELIHTAFNKSFLGKLIRPITSFFVNI